MSSKNDASLEMCVESVPDVECFTKEDTEYDATPTQKLFYKSLLDYDFDNFDKTSFLINEIVSPSADDVDGDRIGEYLDLKFHVSKLSSMNSSNQSELFSLRSILKELTTETIKLRATCSSMIKDQRILLSQQDFEEQLKKNQSTIKSLQMEYEAQVLENTRLLESVSSLQKEDANHVKRYNDLLKKFNTLSLKSVEDIKSNTRKVEQINEELRKYKKTQKADSATIERLTSQLQKSTLEAIEQRTQRMTLERIVAKSANNEALVNDYKKSLKDVKYELSEKEKEILELKSQNEQLQSQNSILSNRITILEDTLNLITDERDSLNLSVTKLEKKLSVKNLYPKEDLELNNGSFMPMHSSSFQNFDFEFANWSTNLNFGLPQ